MPRRKGKEKENNINVAQLVYCTNYYIHVLYVLKYGRNYWPYSFCKRKVVHNKDVILLVCLKSTAIKHD